MNQKEKFTLLSPQLEIFDLHSTILINILNNMFLKMTLFNYITFIMFIFIFINPILKL